MKLKISNLNKLIEDMSGREIDFYLYLIKRQNEIGFVEGVTHTQMQKDIGMPRSTFHVVLANLEEKGMVRVDWDNRNKYFNFFIEDNVFLSLKDYKKAYLNINIDFILSNDFTSLNVNLKKFFLRLLSLKANVQQVKLLKDTLKRYKVNKYIDKLHELFDIVVDDNIIMFTIKPKLLKSSCNDEYLEYENKIENYCEEYNLEYTKNELHDTVRSIINHTRKGRFALIQKALDAIRRAGRLQPRLVNHICKPTY